MIFKIETILASRLQKALKYWKNALLKSPTELKDVHEEDLFFSPKITVII